MGAAAQFHSTGEILLGPDIGRNNRLKFFYDYIGGGAWPILVGVLRCLVDSDNERDYNK